MKKIILFFMAFVFTYSYEILDKNDDINTKLMNLKLENRRLNGILKYQNEKLKTMKIYINDIENTKNKIHLLENEMFDEFQKLIFSSNPFSLEIRKKALVNLKEYLKNDEVSSAQKLIKILENYELEYDFTKSVESYEILTNGKICNFLRIGRIGLYKISLDNEKYQIWDKNSKNWCEIEGFYDRLNIQKALKISKKQMLPTLLTLPFIKGNKI